VPATDRDQTPPPALRETSWTLAHEPTAERRSAVLELARAANSDTWWHSYVGTALPKWFELYVDLEAEASELSIFDPQYINGLVQTEEYARAMMAARPDESDKDIDRTVAMRMERQKRLTEGRLRLQLIIDESALRREFGSPEVMKGQLEHLLELSKLRRVSLQILPERSQPGIVGGFTILEFPEEDDPTVVYIEHDAGALTLEKPTHVRQYTRAYGRLRTAALDRKASAAHIAEVIKEM
jgi:uncharacterized protein DUF5753